MTARREPRQDEWGLSDRQRAFLNHHFSGKFTRAGDAYEAAGYSPKGSDTSASKLLKNPKCRKYLAHLRAELHEQLMNNLGAAALEAAQVLRDVAGAPESPPQTRVSASKALLDVYMSGHKAMQDAEAIANGGADFARLADAASKLASATDEAIAQDYRELLS